MPRRFVRKQLEDKLDSIFVSFCYYSYFLSFPDHVCLFIKLRIFMLQISIFQNRNPVTILLLGHRYGKSVKSLTSARFVQKSTENSR